MNPNPPQPPETTEDGKKQFDITPEKIAEFEFRAHEISAETLVLSKAHKEPRLMDPILKRTGLICLAGTSDTGKSAFLRQLGMAIVTGEPDFLGFTINATHHSIIYVSTEDDEASISEMLEYQSCDYQPDQLRKLRFIFDYEDILQKLDVSLTATPADAILIDCYADAVGGDLKDTNQIRLALKGFQALSRKHKVLVLFLHHTSKRSEHSGPSKNNLLSGQGFEAKMRLVMELCNDMVDPNLRHLCIVKCNYLGKKYKNESYVLNFNESLLRFTNTGERTPFDSLVKSSESDEGKAKFEKALELQQQGKSYLEIADILKYSSKGSVSALFAKARAKGWIKDDEGD